MGFPIAGTVLLTVNSFFTKYDDSQWAFGVAAIIMAMFPVGALYGVTVWIAERSSARAGHIVNKTGDEEPGEADNEAIL